MDFGMGLAQLGSEMIGRRHQWYFDKKAIEHNQRFQREMAQNSLQWRVADAKAAGVHPLFAVGAQLPSGTFAGGASGSSGSQVGQVMSAAAAREQQDRVVRAQVDNLDAQSEMFRSQADFYKRRETGNAPQMPMPGAGFGDLNIEGASAAYVPVQEPPVVQVRPGHEGHTPGDRDLIQNKPAQITSGRTGSPGITAGVPRGTSEYEFPMGRGRSIKVLLPSKEASEPIESVGELAQALLVTPLIISTNLAYYGTRFIDDLKTLLGAATFDRVWNHYQNESFQGIPPMIMNPYRRR